ncbi:hypothetical protein GOBAR_DD18994 [Gossypium barbadense]|nr:hypothetical protein GOBAR_DD18994 [Gossypium barbadense]
MKPSDDHSALDHTKIPVANESKTVGSAWGIFSGSDIHHAPSDATLFSSSLPVFPHEKLNLNDTDQSYQSLDVITSDLNNLHQDAEGNAPLGDIKANALGNLLPDDENELLAGIMDDFDLSGLPSSVEDLEECDLFGSGGGMELEVDPQESLTIGMAKVSLADAVVGNSVPHYSLPNGVGTIAGEHPYGEHPSRTLFVRNINSNVEDSELRALFEQYGDIRTLYTACKHRGFVMISYYDIRAARTAMRALQNKPLRRRKLDIHFSIPKIRETPHKRHHKFIEFYDVRAAEQALKSLNRSDIAGKRIKLEPSRPGGARRRPSKGTKTMGTTLVMALQECGISIPWNVSENSSSMRMMSSPRLSPVFLGNGPFQGLHNSMEGLAENGRSRQVENNNQLDNKKKFQLDLDKIVSGEDIQTTLMIKNIPNKYTSKMLLAAIDENHQGTYDFLYLPIDFKNKCNVGYAFINMLSPSHIIPFYEAFNGKKWEKFNSEKVASLAYARIQGKVALVAHFQNSSLMNEDKHCRPILFHSEGPDNGDQGITEHLHSRLNIIRQPNGLNSGNSSGGTKDKDADVEPETF